MQQNHDIRFFGVFLGISDFVSFDNCRMSIRLMGACVCVIVWFCSVEGIIYQSKANLNSACYFEPFAGRLGLKCTHLCIDAVRVAYPNVW